MNFGPLVSEKERNEYLINYMKTNNIFQTIEYIASHYIEMLDDVRRCVLLFTRERICDVHVNQSSHNAMKILSAHLAGTMPKGHYDVFRRDYDKEVAQGIPSEPSAEYSLNLALSFLLDPLNRQVNKTTTYPVYNLERGLYYAFESLANPKSPNFTTLFQMHAEWFSDFFQRHILNKDEKSL